VRRRPASGATMATSSMCRDKRRVDRTFASIRRTPDRGSLRGNGSCPRPRGCLQLLCRSREVRIIARGCVGVTRGFARRSRWHR
jgi:hypothetical protein